MPAIRPTYNSQSEIPAELQPYYKQNGSVWEVWDDGEAVAKYFNTGLAQNRDALRTEKDQHKTRADQAEQRIQSLTTEKTNLEANVTSKVTEATAPLNTRIQALETELNTVKAPGSVVLSADKATALAEFEKLGTPADVAKLVKEELPAVKAKVLQFEKAESFRKTAQEVGFDPDVLNDIMQLPRNSGLEIKMKKVKTTVKGVNGAADEEKMIDTPHVYQKVAKEGGGEDEVWTPLKDFAESNWKSFLPSLQATSGNGGGEGGEGSGDQNRGTTWPRQNPSGGDQNTGKVDAKKISEQANKARDNAYNPLTNPNPQAAAQT